MGHGETVRHSVGQSPRGREERAGPEECSRDHGTVSHAPGDEPASPTPQEMNPRTREGGDSVLLPCFSSQVVNDLRLGNYDPITRPS